MTDELEELIREFDINFWAAQINIILKKLKDSPQKDMLKERLSKIAWIGMDEDAPESFSDLKTVLKELN